MFTIAMAAARIAEHRNAKRGSGMRQMKPN